MTLESDEMSDPVIQPITLLHASVYTLTKDFALKSVRGARV